MLKRQNRTWFLLAAETSLCVFFFSGSAAGSGFAVIEQSAASAGYACADAAAAAQDASTVFFNPDGMALLFGNELHVGAHYITSADKRESKKMAPPWLRHRKAPSISRS